MLVNGEDARKCREERKGDGGRERGGIEKGRDKDWERGREGEREVRDGGEGRRGTEERDGGERRRRGRRGREGEMEVEAKE